MQFVSMKQATADFFVRMSGDEGLSYYVTRFFVI